ncbi:phosphatidate cytidylyltransferase [Companilactobacillus sp. RD055328]|uniref:phosphatidate cytidylyltransferase n=1 Tax=Companilactobacillus sp. RD055328 TaxID=2916634 RepID=UPI001FC7D8EA|nr:phosphatidate cytidylyltransferase [Companilactobacillus sp. RD055328]GKQ42607.1 phosphatidate cytidylyltransferase [Companilactobacillus sp. RD055328]
MKQRIITAVVALAIFIPILIMGGIWIDVAATALACIGISEVYIMRKRIIVSPDFFLTLIGVIAIAVPKSFYNGWLPESITQINIFYSITILLLLWTVISKNKFSFEDAGVSAISMIYIGTGFHYLAAIRNTGSTYVENGFYLLMFALLIVWITDSGAYFMGKAFGKHKLNPYISPNKTWEGSIGGTVIAVVVASIYAYFLLPEYNIYFIVIVAIICSIAGQLGDLLESAYKRFYKVKDSGKILPGHGGILDRFDSMLIVLPLIHLLSLV